MLKDTSAPAFEHKEHPLSKKKERKFLKMSEVDKLKYTRGHEIIACCKSKDIARAAELLHICSSEGSIPGEDTMTSLICLFGGIGDEAEYNTQLCLEAFDLAVSLSIVLKEPAYTAVIRCLAKDGRVLEAVSKLHLLRASDHDIPRLRTYSPLIASYMELRDIDSCFNLLSEVLAEEIVPNEHFMTCLLRSCQQAHDCRFWFILSFLNEFVVSELSDPTVSVIKDYLNDAGYYSSQLINQDSSNQDTFSQLSSLNPLSLSENEFSDLRDCMKTQFNSHSTIMSNNVDVILDGANIGYSETNFPGSPSHINYHQLSWVVDHIQNDLHKTVMIVLHTRHVDNDQLPADARAIVDKWVLDGLVIQTPRGRNDDLYWMTAALQMGSGTSVVTNDEMRDHLFNMYEDKINRKRKRVCEPNSNLSAIHASVTNMSVSCVDIRSKLSTNPCFSPLLAFLKRPLFDIWRERHVIRFEFGPWDSMRQRRIVVLKYPPEICRVCQQGQDGSLFVPIKSNDLKWLVGRRLN